MTRNRLLPFAIASAILLSIGCGGGSGPISLPPGSASNIYVVQNTLPGVSGLNSILEFPANSQGSVTPTNTITIPMQSFFDAVAVDTSGNLYTSTTTLANPTYYQILVYAPGATGAATPIRTITGLPSSVNALAVDSTGQIYALTHFNINVYAANATGNATPVRQITSDINSPYAMAVDSAHNIYVANYGWMNIEVFSATAAANGDDEPIRTIAGSNTQLSYYSYGIAVDATGDVFATTESVAGSNLSAILEFAPNANGNAAPIKTLTAVSSYQIKGIKVDSAGNLFTVVVNNNNLQFAVDVFSPTATGSESPSQIISSSAWTNSELGQIAIQ
jgi:hypothetical protein